MDNEVSKRFYHVSERVPCPQCSHGYEAGFRKNCRVCHGSGRLWKSPEMFVSVVEWKTNVSEAPTDENMLVVVQQFKSRWVTMGRKDSALDGKTWITAPDDDWCFDEPDNNDPEMVALVIAYAEFPDVSHLPFLWGKDQEVTQ